MNSYTRDQIRQAMYDLFAKDNGRQGKSSITDAQYMALGMVMTAIEDYDKANTQSTPTPQ